ncbi:Grainyhead-like protein 1 homolog [Caenorhabditis elegans]|uniref:Grainyhead-like protein 1 homolog n=1 Tax=Caenorhabditis elegans TaxID=6239 RepID=GRH1_CAEEL|nr:Grainyhead-like protein 1 homolog [Caenorhabditis elegans]G5EDF0.1 RecName: Full=Grainyhead-like protein 1 homolog [Caenorhabditis elegans]AAP78770.1 grainyhead transcription factor [Caenorhabditis elegans]CCD72954.1 Grainyhead-like protein 1 homolog [Caenorhabditis elegans]|eukprot:NP_490837.2 GRainyHead (Drosophila transcription factor) homolog [Caenorhabditis elegans]
MSFQLDQSTSVIKTAPPGRLEFKNEPIDIASSNIQDLAKMQTLDGYYQQTSLQLPQSQQYHRMYENVYNNQQILYAQTQNFQYPSTLLTNGSLAQTEWRGQQMDTSAYSNTGYSRSSTSQQPQYTQQVTENERIVYKPVDMPSPVDSGIGGDISILNPKEEFFTSADGGSMLERSSERTLSHRDSPLVIPKLYNNLGFQYVLEAPISTSVRRDDDRMTYVNKGQFYTVSLEYTPDLNKCLKSQTVKSQLMVVFREDKTYEEEIKTWQSWHARQHVSKQRILEIDSKNSSGMIGQIEEIGNNAVQFYWNPSDPSGVRISIAVQCLSTDFSTQKGVKGLPLHVQIDTYDGENDKVPFHRGYCQIKVFCDKGAERKLRDEDKRAQKRKVQEYTAGALPGGRKKSDGEYHDQCERSEFYHMRELDKPAALFIAPEEFEPRYVDSTSLSFDMSEIEPIPTKRPRTSERIMLYVRKRDEQIYQPLHVVPASLSGLALAIANKFGADPDKMSGVYKRCAKGITVKVDDEMLRLYCNEDTFIIDVEHATDGSTAATLIEVAPTNPNSYSNS